jgi:branched-chain amino acid transport system permease protein
VALPIRLRERSGAWWAYVVIAWTAALVLLAAVPFIANEPFRINQYAEVLGFAVAILGLNLVIGYSGQISLGHSAFVGIGAYTTVILVADHGWSYLPTIPVAAVICFAVGMIIGLPALRIRGLYLAVVTLALAVTFPTLVLKYDGLTGGPNGKKAEEWLPPSWTGLDPRDRFDRSAWLYWVLLVIAIGMFILARNLIKSRVGRAVIAIRDNQTGAAVAGVNVPIYKTLVFGVSALFAGVGGSMFAIEAPFVSDTQFGLNLAVILLVGLVAGGVGTISGAIPGALLVVFVPWYTAEWSTQYEIPWLSDRPGSGAVANVLFGLLLIVLVFVLPGGIIDGLRRLRARFVRVVPNPSWLADVAPAPPGAGSSGQAASVTEVAPAAAATQT